MTMINYIKDKLLVKERIPRYGSLGDLSGGREINYHDVVPTRLGKFVQHIKDKVFYYTHKDEIDNF